MDFPHNQVTSKEVKEVIMKAIDINAVGFVLISGKIQRKLSQKYIKHIV